MTMYQSRQRPAGPGWWQPILAVLLMITYVSPLFAEEAEYSTWSDAEVLESATASRQDGDCLWALKLYRLVLSRSTDPDIVPRALYGQGLCLEQGQFAKDAAASYREIIREHPDASLARDAWFRLGILYENEKKYKEAEDCYLGILRRYKSLNAADHRTVEVQLAWELLLQRHTRAALRRFNRVLEEWEQYPAEELREERFYIGKTHIALGSALSEYADEIDFRRPPPGKGLAPYLFRRATGQYQKWLSSEFTERESRIQAARYHYDLAARQKSAIWSSAAYLLSGLDCVAHYHALNDAPVPKELDEDQTALYSQLLQKKTREYLVAASQLFLRGHEMAVASGDSSLWASMLAEKVSLIEDEGVDALAELPDASGAFWAWDHL